MKKRVIGILCPAFLSAGMGLTAYASPQKPFDWQGYNNSYSFNWSDDTAVEMRNGDGTDVMTVNGQYIIDHMLPETSWPIVSNNGGIPDNVKTVPCQVVKEDAYIIMPFDGYVSIGLVDRDLAADYSTICVRAKAGDRVNMVPKNLIMTYYHDFATNPNHEYEKCYVDTTPDDWTYQLRIYKEQFVPLCPAEWRGSYYRDRDGNIVTVDSLPDELISRPLRDNMDSYACLWFIYQVDAPDSLIRSKPYDTQAYELAMNPDREFCGWIEDPRVDGRWTYHVRSNEVSEWLGTSPTTTLELYQSDKLAIKDHDLYIEDRKVTTCVGYGSGVWIEPQYNIVNVQ